MHVRELVRNEEGMVTVESAYALAALLLIFLLCIGGLSATLVQIRVTDSAHMIARAVARGATRAEAESYLAPTMVSTVQENEDSVEVVVQQRTPLLPLTLTGRATFPREKITYDDTSQTALGRAQLVVDRDENGAATVWSATLAAVVCLLLVGIITISGVLHTRQQAAHLAEGAAMAAAQAIPYHFAETCQRANDWVRTQAPQNHLVSCAVREHSHTHMPAVWVEVEVEYARWNIRGRACAGPVPPR